MKGGAMEKRYRRVLTASENTLIVHEIACLRVDDYLKRPYL